MVVFYTYPPATDATLNVDDDTVYEPHSDGETSQSPDPSRSEEGLSDKLSQDPHNGEGPGERLVMEDNINVFKRRNLDNHSDSEVEEITIQQVRQIQTVFCLFTCLFVCFFCCCFCKC